MSTAPPGPPRQITREAVATPTGHPAARGQPGPAERSGVTVNDRWSIRYRCVANTLLSYEFSAHPSCRDWACTRLSGNRLWPASCPVPADARRNGSGW